ncbi:MAG TPA: hypothetical protein DC013_03800 [Ruminococcaceae bacterium]|nr:hypothetical protein [Oscillospiraceae bacterium]
MCLMITLLAAVVSTIVWYVNAPQNKLKLGTLSLMYWGASLMWMVDGFFCIAEGEPFLDLSANDALLGLLIVICGLVAWLLILLCSDPKKVFQFRN